MSEAEAPRRRRFPLQLGDTQPAPRRLVQPPGVPLPATARRPAATPTLAPVAATRLPQDPAASLPIPPEARRAEPSPGSVRAGVAPDPAQAPDPAPAPEALGRLRRGDLQSTWPAPDPEGAAARARMVERLRLGGCRDDGVLQALGHVARHRFVDPGLAAQAYEDTSLPIGLGQTISKPSVVARMLELLRARPGGPALGRVLEIGTGCGYQAAVLVLLARQVYSVERLRGLYDRARDNLAATRPSHLRLVYGDGRLGHPPNAPYDGIVAAAGGPELPAAWLAQLAPGGRLVAPVQDSGGVTQSLTVVDRLPDGSLQVQRHEAVRFVPLESGTSELGML
ncbi:MAG: protein-L-isoaspartate(D-aspartate) O-methyltransferase [Burkholderiaceae bacterium]|nr:protein-L-isoaspartate(D-aspartate) O-methyltransferase [Burkholderiaceae bacterium]